jgi:hypothetical protein
LDTGLKSPVLLRAAGGAWLRLGEYPRAVEMLQQAAGAGPMPPSATRDLIIGYLATGQDAEAAKLLEPYVAERSDDADLLLAAAYVMYSRYAAGAAPQSFATDRERMARYAQAYAATGGPHRELVDLWRAFVEKR